MYFVTTSLLCTCIMYFPKEVFHYHLRYMLCVCVTVYTHSGVPVGVYLTSSTETCCAIACDSKAQVIVVENYSQLQKILKVSQTRGRYFTHFSSLFILFTWRIDTS